MHVNSCRRAEIHPQVLTCALVCVCVCTGISSCTNVRCTQARACVCTFSPITNVILAMSAEDMCIYVHMCVFQCVSYY